MYFRTYGKNRRCTEMHEMQKRELVIVHKRIIDIKYSKKLGERKHHEMSTPMISNGCTECMLSSPYYGFL